MDATDFVKLGLTFLLMLVFLGIFADRVYGRVAKVLNWSAISLLIGTFGCAIGLIWTV